MLNNCRETDHYSILEEHIESASIDWCTGVGLLLRLTATSEQTADHVDKEHTNQKGFEHCPTTDSSLLLLLLSLNFSILANSHNRWACTLYTHV